jgi:hypothetical protein
LDFELNGFIVMFESLRVVLRSLFPQRIAEIVVGFGEVGIFRKRLLELDLGFGELLGTHELDPLVINLNRLVALLSFLARRLPVRFQPRRLRLWP